MGKHSQPRDHRENRLRSLDPISQIRSLGLTKTNPRPIRNLISSFCWRELKSVNFEKNYQKTIYNEKETLVSTSEKTIYCRGNA